MRKPKIAQTYVSRERSRRSRRSRAIGLRARRDRESLGGRRGSGKALTSQHAQNTGDTVRRIVRCGASRIEPDFALASFNLFARIPRESARKRAHVSGNCAGRRRMQSQLHVWVVLGRRTTKGGGERRGRRREQSRVQTSVIEQRHKAGGYARPAALVVRSLCDLLPTDMHPTQRRPPRRAGRLQLQDNEFRTSETLFSRCPVWSVAGNRSAAVGATLRVRPPCATLAHRRPHGTDVTECATRRLERLAYLARPGRFTRDLLCVSILARPPAAKSMRGGRRKTGPGGSL